LIRIAQTIASWATVKAVQILDALGNS